MRTWRSWPAVCAAVAWGTLALAAPAPGAPGDLDTASFGSAGVFTAPLPPGGQGDTRRVAVDADGRALLTFTRNTDADSEGDVLVVARLATSGSLDTSFNPLGATPGLVEVDLGPAVAGTEHVYAKGIRPGPDGSVLALATTRNDATFIDRVAVVRLTSTGALDGGFGAGGRIVDSSGPGYQVTAFSLAVDASGRPLVGGIVQDLPDLNGAVVTRYTAAGAPDSSWGPDGRVAIPMGNGVPLVALAALPGGGVAFVGRGDIGALVGRITAGGELDASFSGDGVASTDFGAGSGNYSEPNAIAADAEGRIVVGGFANTSPFESVGAVARFTAGGALDPAFGTGTPATGIVWLPYPSRLVTGVAIGCSDRVLAGGFSRIGTDADFALARLTAAGLLDTTFAAAALTPGFATSDFGSSEVADALAIDGTGRAYLAGLTGVGGPAADARVIVGRHLDTTGCAPGEEPPGPQPPPAIPPPATPPSTGSGAPATNALATFTPSTTRPGALRRVTFDARGSVRPGSSVVAYRWDTTGDGRTDATCGPETPLLETDFARAGTRTVSLVVEDSLGAKTTASQTLSVTRTASTATVTGPTKGTAGRAFSVARRSYERTFLAAPAPTTCEAFPGSDASRRDVTGLGGPAAGCVTSLQIPNTLIDAVGCLQETKLEDLPAPERQIINSEILGYFDGLSTPSGDIVTVSACRQCPRGAPARGRAHAAALTPVEAALLLKMAQQVQAGAARFWVAGPGTTVRINGLDYRPDPAPGAGASRIVIVGPGMIGASPRLAFPAIVSSGAAISLPTDTIGRVTLRSKARIVTPIDTDKKQIAQLRLLDDVPFAEKTHLRGLATVLLRDKASDLKLEASLPDLFSKPGGGEITGSVTLRATNRDGVRLRGFTIGTRGFDRDNIDAEIAGVGVVLDYLSYEPPRLAGRARVSFMPVGAIEGEIAVNEGDLEYLDVTYTAGPPGIKVAPAVFLTQVRAGFEDSAQRTAVFGGASLAAGTGIGGDCLPVGVNATDPPGFDFQIDPRPTTLTLQGQLQLACINVGFQRFVLAEDGYASFTAGMNDFELGPVKVSANWSVAYYDGHFTAEAKARADIGDYVGVNGSALLSDKGLAFCAEVLGVDVGFGLPWSPPPLNILVLIDNIELMGPLDCDVGPWRTVSVRGASASQAGATTFTIPESQRAQVVEITGANEAPTVTLRSPSGKTFAMPPTDPLRSADAVLFRVPKRRATYAVLRRPAAGTWSVSTEAGTRITGLRAAGVVPEPQVTARLTRGRGGRRLLSYDVAPRPRQVVRLFEKAPGGTRLLTTIRGGGRGRIPYTPSDARGSRRSIIAMVEQDGKPRDRIVVHRFTMPPPQIGRVTRVRAVRSRTGLLRISWSPASGAQSYLVGIELSDGRRRAIRPRGNARQVTVPRVSSGTRVKLSVLGARVGGVRRGPATTLRLTVR